MVTFHINDEQNDESVPYARGMLNRTNSGGPSVQSNQKKKPYRARGCRGGASRKGRKKQTPISDSRQDEENDPYRLNNNCEQRRSSDHLSETIQHCKVFHAADMRASIRSGPIESISDIHSYSQQTVQSQLFVPYGDGSNVHQRTSGTASDANIEVELLDRSKNRDHYGRGTMPILPLHCDDTSHAILAASVNGINKIPAVCMPEKRFDDTDGQSNGGGFSFFCISPCSFLSGQRKKMERTTF
jgi:hypothetical protein